MKPIIRKVGFIFLILVSLFVLVIGIVALNGDAINDQIDRFFQVADFAAGTDLALVTSIIYTRLFLAGVALIIIGLIGLLIGLVSVYDIINGKRSLQAIRSAGSVVGLALFLISAGTYWYLFRDLFWSFSMMGRINETIPGLFSQLFPWQFAVPFTVGLILLVLAIVKYSWESRMRNAVIIS